MTENMSALIAGVTYVLQWDKVNSLLIMKQQKSAVDLAGDLILQINFFKTMQDNEEIWYYEEGCYYQQGENIIKKILQNQEQIKQTISTNFVNEVIQSIMRKTYIKREEFEAPVNLICLGNGIYDLEMETMQEHTPKFYFKSKIGINYNEGADCPQIKKFVESVVEKKNFWILFEIPAYLLYRDYKKIQKAIMLNGTNDNGKSVYIKLLQAFVGKNNYSSEELQQIGHDRFSKAELFGKLMNSCADLPAIIMENTGDFKKLTAGDTVSAQRKFGQPFQFENHAKLIFSANEVPETKDLTDGFFKRWDIVDFPFLFIKGLKQEDVTDICKLADDQILEKITTKEELEGLLRSSLFLLKKLIVQGTFTNSLPVQEIKQRYLIKSNSAVVFIETELTDSIPDEMKDTEFEPIVAKEHLWSEYLAFCKAKRTMPRTLTGFYLEIKNRWSVPTEKRSIELGVRKNCFVGVRYLGNWRKN
ncbi:MAG: phage/plasmid primase, P4 family [archaeon]|jgi:putative DNA primase/helicase